MNGLSSTVVFVNIQYFLFVQVKYETHTDHVAIWKEMEKLVDSGKCRAIGVSNFTSDQLERVQKIARIPIAVNQVECNAYFQQKKLRETMDSLGIKVMAFAPLGSPGRLEISKILTTLSLIRLSTKRRG